jgi:hypothetical protein
MKKIYIDLVLDDGNLVRIECPGKFEDELYASLEDAMKCGDWWSTRRFDRCTAQYKGYCMDRVNMARVVGML